MRHRASEWLNQFFKSIVNNKANGNNSVRAVPRPPGAAHAYHCTSRNHFMRAPRSAHACVCCDQAWHTASTNIKGGRKFTPFLAQEHNLLFPIVFQFFPLPLCRSPHDAVSQLTSTLLTILTLLTMPTLLPSSTLIISSHDISQCWRTLFK